MTKRVLKTVAFFEVRGETGEQLVAENWQSVLSDLELQRVRGSMLDLRHDFNGAAHYAQVYTYQEEDHLVLARERDEPPSSLNVASGEILDEATSANRPWVEVSVISFIPGTNIFGFVLGTMASPRSGAVADWLNEHETFDDLVTVEPYISDSLLKKLNDSSSEARLVRVRLDAAQLNDPIAAQGLYSQSQALGRQLELGPEVEVEVTLKIRGRVDHATPDTRRRLADIGRGLMGRAMQAGQVELVDLEQGSADKELVDLIKHKMTTRENVSVLDADAGGRQVRIPSAVTAIGRAASKLGITGG